MNLTDLCPRGRELYAEYLSWRKRREMWTHSFQPIAFEVCDELYRDYQQHLRECELCGEEEW
jgi:hypothetical protein